MPEKEQILQPTQALAELAATAQLSTEELQLKFQFWKPKWKGSEANRWCEDVAIDYLVFYEFLYSKGFRRFDIEEESIFIQISNNRIVRRVKVVVMQDCVIDFIDSLDEEVPAGDDYIPRSIIKSKVVRSLGPLFNEQRLYLLKPKENIVFNRDTIDTKYFYFNNGFLEITKDKIDFKNYDKLAGYIWESEILKHKYTKPKTNEAKDYIAKYFWNVSGKKPNRFADLKIIAGYLTHNYTNYKLKCPNFTDSRIEQSREANGRSGKTFLARIIGGVISTNTQDPSIKSYVEINGKNFDAKDKHRYSSCDIDTKLVVLNDVQRNFDVTTLYNDITEGVAVDKKGLQPFRIMPKIILISNESINTEGSSSRDRFIEYELADHYSDKYTPEMEFGHWFFRDWTEEDYCRYFQFMASCSQDYFKANCKLPQPEQINLNARKLISTTNVDFIDFIENTLRPIHNQRYAKNTIFQQFIGVFPDYDNQRFTQARFRTWVINYMNYNEKYQNFLKEVNEPRTSTERYFVFLEAAKKTDEL